MEKPTNMIVLGETVYNAEEIYKYDKRFFVGCVNSRKIVEKDGLDESMYFYAYEKDGTWIKSNENYKRAKLFLREEYVLQNVPKMMEHTETQKTEKLYKYEEAPEVLELKEHEKFKDVNGTTIKIEVRGTRKHNDCYFRVKDVSDGFGLPNIQTTINNKENCYELGIHYKVFNTPIMLKGYDGSNKKSNKRVLYLTFLGMLRVLFCSRTSGNAEKFQIWATEKLFTVQMGAAEDRDELAAELIGVNAKTVGDVFRANSSKTPSVYLIYIGAAAELLRDPTYTTDQMLCKFGCTDDFPRRIAEHHRYFKREFGNDCNIEILQFSIIEAQFIHNAETNIAQYFKTNLVKYKTSRELIVINKDDLPHIKQHYSMIQANYIGRFSELYAQLAEKEKEILALQYKLSELAEKHRNELQAERHKCEIMTERYKLQTEVMAEKHRNELKDKDIELLTTKVKFMEKK